MIEFSGVTPMLKTDDIPGTVEFYRDLLGFTVDTLWPETDPTLCILDRDAVHLIFLLDADWDAPGAPPTMTGQLSIDVSDVDGLHADLLGRVEILWGPETYDYGRREFSIRDCNGYRLVFSQLI
ncbi:MAG: VOC family protein [Acidimicrobiia bacterium]|nr:VOC family protein [Acidimicrobiia bacterium]